MKNRIKRMLKSNKLLYLAYGYFGSLTINILKIFVPSDDKLILFVCYGGKKYDDSPKAISEYISNTNKYKNYRLVWAFEDPDEFNIDGVEIIKIDTLKYFIMVLKAKYWVTNTTVKRGLKFTVKDVCYLNTWHGTPIKKIGGDIKRGGKTFKSIETNDDITIMLAQSKYEVDIFTKAFNIPRERFNLTGLPRNDELVNITRKDTEKARQNLGIDNDKKVILYAPTFREYDKDRALNCVTKPPIDFKKWRKELGDMYIFMVRAHHEVGNVIVTSDCEDFVLNVSDHHDINELMIASDMIISDYSSILFDYSLLKKPILCFAYDMDIYIKERGLYLDLEELIPGGILKSENEVINAIIKMDYSSAAKQSEQLSGKYISAYGNASEEAVVAMLGF